MVSVSTYLHAVIFITSGAPESRLYRVGVISWFYTIRLTQEVHVLVGYEHSDDAVLPVRALVRADACTSNYLLMLILIIKGALGTRPAGNGHTGAQGAECVRA